MLFCVDLSPVYIGLKFQHVTGCRDKNIKGLCVGTERSRWLCACHETPSSLRMIDFYGSVEIVTLQLSKEDLLQSIFPVFMTNHC